MNKYDSLKFLKETKARNDYSCENCGREIISGETYYPESVGKVNIIGIKLRKFCKNCYHKYGDELLKKNK